MTHSPSGSREVEAVEELMSQYVDQFIEAEQWFNDENMMHLEDLVVTVIMRARRSSLCKATGASTPGPPQNVDGATHPRLIN